MTQADANAAVAIAAPGPAEGPPPEDHPKDAGLTRATRLLRPTNLFGAVPGPIFQKEVWTSGRKRGIYWGRALYAAGVLGLVTMVFIVSRFERAFNASPSQQLQSLQEMAPQVSASIMGFQFFALTLAGAIFGAPTICDEKRAGTLGTLLTTPLKAWQIVVGKTSAFFVQLLILTLVSTPLLLSIRVFGGITAELIFALTCLSLSSALLAGLLGLYFSIGSKRSPAAIIAAIIASAGVHALIPLTGAILAIREVHVPEWLFGCFSPAVAAFFTMEANFGNSLAVEQARTFWVSSTGFTLALCALTLFASSMRLRRVMSSEALGGAAIPQAPKLSRAERKKLKAAGKTAPDSSDSPVKKSRRTIHHSGESRDVSDSPVLWRELRQSAFRSRKQMLVAAMVLLGALAIFDWQAGLDAASLHYTITVVTTIASLAIAAVSTTSGISGERESRTLEALLTTPLSARQIVYGKFFGALRRQWFVPAIYGVQLVVASAYWTIKLDGLPPYMALLALPLLSGPVVALSGTGVLFSLTCRKSTTAAACNFGLAALMWIALPIVSGMIASAGFSGRSREDVLFTVLSTNPVAMMVQAVGNCLDKKFDLFGWDNLSATTYLVVVVIYWLVYAAMGYISLLVAAGILANRTSRAK